MATPSRVMGGDRGAPPTICGEALLGLPKAHEPRKVVTISRLESWLARPALLPGVVRTSHMPDADVAQWQSSCFVNLHFPLAAIVFDCSP